MEMVTKTKFRPTPGQRFQTNERFAALWPRGSRILQWKGVCIHKHPSIEGAWYVDVEVPEGLPRQVVNARFMEAAA